MKSYLVQKLSRPIQVDARWEKSPWTEIPHLDLDHHMGDKPDHFPGVRAKLAYDHDALYVIFQVKDQYVRAMSRDYQDPVCEDSCVEFFFTPGADTSDGYFNFEVNCGGTALFFHQRWRGVDEIPISESDFDNIWLEHTLPKIVDPEIVEPVTWVVEYRLPFRLLSRYAPIDQPGPGVIWKANFYKCADSCSHPHWLTWSAVDFEIPNFHMPSHFGHLNFE